MVVSSLLILSLLSQTATEPEAKPAVDPELAAAERTAAAAEKTAAAVARLAEVLAPQAAAPAAAPPKKDNWTGSAGFGLTFLTGNSQQLTITATGSAERKWENWALGLRANAAYGLSNPAANVADSTTQTTARRVVGTVRGDRTFGGFASLFVLFGEEADHMKNIETRTIGELGTGLTLFAVKENDAEKRYLRLDLAMRAGYETRWQYFPVEAPIDPYGIAILAPRAAITFRWNFNKHVNFTEELEAIPFLLSPNAGRLLINDTTKLSARVTDSVALTTAVVLAYDSKPPPSTPPRVSTDVALTVGVEATF